MGESGPVWGIVPKPHDGLKGDRTVALHESAEMYLETIYLLAKEKNGVRSVDVADHMGFSKPSVSRAVGLLKRDGYVQTDEEGFLVLTELGIRTAERVFERHTMLTRMLVAIGVPEDLASEDACRIEHVISDETLEAVKRFLEKG